MKIEAAHALVMHASAARGGAHRLLAPDSGGHHEPADLLRLSDRQGDRARAPGVLEEHVPGSDGWRSDT